MAAGTALSRVMGFFRLMLLVFLFGNATRQADMVTIANTVPNSMYILLAGGVLNTVLVPQIVRAIRGDKDGGEAYTNRIMTAGLLVLAMITVLLTLAVPVIIWLYSAEGWKAPGAVGAVLLDDRPRLLHDAPGLLLRRARAGRAGAERPRPVRPDDVGTDRQQPRLHRGPAAVLGGLRPDRHRGAVHRRPGAVARTRLHPGYRGPGRRADPLPPRQRATGSGPAGTSGTPVWARPSGWPSGPSASSWSTRQRSS